jgi:large subunit ribosomal protein L15
VARALYTPPVAFHRHGINKKRRVCPCRRSKDSSGKGECDMKLNELADNPGAAKKQKRVARGPGSGKGKTAGRGIKGQKSRSGVAIGGYEGGQMPLYRRLPKRGFTKPNAKEYAVINLGLIEKFIGLGKLDVKAEITEDVLVAAGLTSTKRDGIRILNKGAITTKVTLVVTGASAAAVEAVAAAGGSLTVAPVLEPHGKPKRKAQ